tara:strand:+ start:380 stop:724 length:345 start_codon:yes stop_codon:yes gene_type:complete
MGKVFEMSLTGKPPIGLKKPKPERGTKAAKEHIHRVKQLPCVICRKHGPSDAHHIICDRYGHLKASDFDIIPLCKAHHQDGPEAIHNGKRSWVEKNGPDHGYLETVKDWLEEFF